MLSTCVSVWEGGLVGGLGGGWGADVGDGGVEGWFGAGVFGAEKAVHDGGMLCRKNVWYVFNIDFFNVPSCGSSIRCLPAST